MAVVDPPAVAGGPGGGSVREAGTRPTDVPAWLERIESATVEELEESSGLGKQIMAAVSSLLDTASHGHLKYRAAAVRLATKWHEALTNRCRLLHDVQQDSRGPAGLQVGTEGILRILHERTAVEVRGSCVTPDDQA